LTFTHVYRDARRIGFVDRAPLSAAIDWIDAQTFVREPETVPVREAICRVLAVPVAAPADLPPADCVAVDGYAVRADDIMGADFYNPVVLSVLEPQQAGPALSTGNCVAVEAGVLLPAGADAVLPFEYTRAIASSIEVLTSVAAGHGVALRGEQARCGAELLPAARRIRPADAGLLMALDLERVRVRPRPRVHIVVAGPRSDERVGSMSRDANGPMLRTLVARDGGDVQSLVVVGKERTGLRDAITASSADVMLIAGRTGTGADDEAPVAVAQLGVLAIHGIAMRPGGSAGLGSVESKPVVLLPGGPVACLAAYDLLGGRLLRRLAGLSAELPYVRREVELRRKVVSPIGFSDVVWISVVEDRAEPLGSLEGSGVVITARADGFLLVPASVEGYPAGARVTAYIYDLLADG
jgi:molybdopterin molybdotransferase